MVSEIEERVKTLYSNAKKLDKFEDFFKETKEEFSQIDILKNKEDYFMLTNLCFGIDKKVKEVEENFSKPYLGFHFSTMNIHDFLISNLPENIREYASEFIMNNLEQDTAKFYEDEEQILNNLKEYCHLIHETKWVVAGELIKHKKWDVYTRNLNAEDCMNEIRCFSNNGFSNMKTEDDYLSLVSPFINFKLSKVNKERIKKTHPFLTKILENEKSFLENKVYYNLFTYFLNVSRFQEKKGYDCFSKNLSYAVDALHHFNKSASEIINSNSLSQKKYKKLSGKSHAIVGHILPDFFKEQAIFFSNEKNKEVKQALNGRSLNNEMGNCVSLNNILLKKINSGIKGNIYPRIKFYF